MRRLNSFFVALSASLTIVACGKNLNNVSAQKSMSDMLSLDILTEGHEFETSPASYIGGLATPLKDPSNPSEVYWDVSCSAFQINATHIVTAAHCIKKDQVFARQWRSRGTNRKEFKVVPLGDSPRLVFMGELVENAEESLNGEETLSVVWIDIDRDIALLRQTKISGSEPLMAQAVQVGMSIVLWSYPNGMPATKSYNCKILDYDDQTGRILHNCDSLNGSSGGLITNEKGETIGLHQKGGFRNSYRYFQQNGKFETISDPSMGNQGLSLIGSHSLSIP